MATYCLFATNHQRQLAHRPYNFDHDGGGNVAVKFNFLCSAYFWIPCTVQITKNIFLDFSSFTGVINTRAKLSMNYSYMTFLLRNYTYTERFTESMRSKDT